MLLCLRAIAKISIIVIIVISVVVVVTIGTAVITLLTYISYYHCNIITGKTMHIIGVMIIIDVLDHAAASLAHGYSMHACSLQQEFEQDAAVALLQIIQGGVHSKRQAEDAVSDVLYIGGTNSQTQAMQTKQFDTAFDASCPEQACHERATHPCLASESAPIWSMIVLHSAHISEYAI